MSDVPRNIDEQIRQAMARGDFDNLPGKGKPLDLSENPYEDPGWRMAYRMLKENGYTLPWIETRRNIELNFERAAKSLQQSWDWRKTATGRRGLMHAEREWQQALHLFRDEVAKLNKRIRDYNLEIPSDQFQRRQINPDIEINKITNSSD
jgi:DnaJ homolog subfamily C member 28